MSRNRRPPSPLDVSCTSAIQNVREHMEDCSFQYETKNGWHILGVLDGHGGSAVAQSLCRSLGPDLAKALVSHSCLTSRSVMRRCLENVLIQADQHLLRAAHTGCTVTLLVVAPYYSDSTLALASTSTLALASSSATTTTTTTTTRRAFLVNVGDSRTVVYRPGSNTTPHHHHQWKVVARTRDHKPNDSHERRRIEKAGGRVTKDEGDDYRIEDKVNMSRALGDHDLKMDRRGRFTATGGALSALPSIVECWLQPRDVVVLASDGLWDVMSSSQVPRLVSDFDCHTLVEQAQSRGSTDNITVLVARL